MVKYNDYLIMKVKNIMGFMIVVCFFEHTIFKIVIGFIYLFI